MPYRLHPVNAVSIRHAPAPCVGCVFWQTKPGRTTDKDRWAERIEDEWGDWGTLYVAEEERLLGFIQFGPAEHFPRAQELPAGPPSSDAVLVTCAYLVDRSAPWVIQSLFLSVIGEARDRGVRAIETFGYRYPEGESPYERFVVHRTIFPSDFLADFGFFPVRWEGRVALGDSSSADSSRLPRGRARESSARSRRRSSRRPSRSARNSSRPSRIPAAGQDQRSGTVRMHLAQIRHVP